MAEERLKLEWDAIAIGAAMAINTSMARKSNSKNVDPIDLHPYRERWQQSKSAIATLREVFESGKGP